MSQYTRDQLNTIRAINQIANKRYADDPSKRRRFKLTAFETGSVESNFHNLSGGDADSAGWRQERASFYKNPTNLHASINRFFDELEQHDRGQKTGELAADVQRPAAQYRGRYQTKLAEARALAGGGAAKTYGVAAKDTPPTLTPGGSSVDTRGAVSAALLDHSSGGSLAQRMIAQVTSGKFTTTTAPKVTSGTAPKYTVGAAAAPPAGSPSSAGGKYMARAGAINAKHLPYLWGGGHGGKVNAFKATPLDCSGAVSAVLGINPRVAAQFETWGKAGDGGSKGVTVYAKSTHVIMKINGHFFGTSGSNPGGGAGWIKASQLPAGYLAGFVARHQ